MAAARRVGEFDEVQRMAAVRRYDILDTPPDGAFDRVTALAARFCRVPISTITVVDEDRIWFKSAHGIDVDEIGRDPGLCASAVMQLDPYVVGDAAVDPRTLNNPLVRGELGLRFYVGVPLTTADGYNLGTLNVIDVHPRTVSDDEIDTLVDLAAIVVDELELRLAARRAIELEAERENARYRDRVIAGLSHDLRTPLAVLQGFAALTADGGHDADSEDVRQLMRRQVAHLDWLVRQFLDYATLESGRQPTVYTTPAAVGQVVADAVDLVADRASVAVDVRGAAGALLVDRGRCWQIIVELLNNAIRFAGCDASITVHVSTGDDDRVDVTVEDRGPGIDPDVLESIFDKGGRSPDSPGTGLGLYLGRRFAEAMGGRLEVSSTPGVGCRFTLAVPAIGVKGSS